MQLPPRFALPNFRKLKPSADTTQSIKAGFNRICSSISLIVAVAVIALVSGYFAFNRSPLPSQQVSASQRNHQNAPAKTQMAAPTILNRALNKLQTLTHRTPPKTAVVPKKPSSNQTPHQNNQRRPLSMPVASNSATAQHFNGVITAVDQTKITLQFGQEPTTATIMVANSTRVFGMPISDAKPNDRLSATAAKQPDGSWLAETISVHPSPTGRLSSLPGN